jgi:uncharacterized membrane protein
MAVKDSSASAAWLGIIIGAAVLTVVAFIIKSLGRNL